MPHWQRTSLFLQGEPLYVHIQTREIATEAEGERFVAVSDEEFPPQLQDAVRLCLSRGVVPALITPPMVATALQLLGVL